MGAQARNYSTSTIKRLFALSGNQCSFPGCTKVLVNTKNAKDSNICHIEAAQETGERYRAEMTDKERADYANLILLCVQHHDETNDVEKYTVEDLKEMKTAHEQQHLQQKLQDNPSMIVETINAISTLDLDDDIEEGKLKVINLDEKLAYNTVQKHKPLIQELKIYHHKINNLYDALEAGGSLKKDKILHVMRRLYLKAKGEWQSKHGEDILADKSYADEIIEKVMEELHSQLANTKIHKEDVLVGVDLLIVDAFMRCKLLEEPTSDDSQ